MPFQPPTLSLEGKLGHLSSTQGGGVPLSALPKDTDHWLKKNKLSLNYAKKNYTFINKRPNISFIAEFQLQLNKTFLKRKHTVKYLGMLLDENLKWCDQIQHLSLELARYSGLFYEIRNFLPRQTLRMLCHSLIYSKLQYSVLVWGTASKTHLRELMFAFLPSVGIVIECLIYTKVYPSRN